MMPSRFWEMASGCLIFVGYQRYAIIKFLLAKVPPILALLLIVGTMYLPSSFSSFSTFAVVLLTTILIAALRKQTILFKVFTNPKVVYIGLISYSLYLWHWGVLSLSRWTIGVHWWTVPIQALLIFALAVASYTWVETPFRKFKWFNNRLFTILSGGSILFATCLIVFPLKDYLYPHLYLQPKISDNLQPEKHNIHISLGNCIGYDDLSSEDIGLIFERCKSSNNREFPEQTTVAFVGDSHALNLFKGGNIFSSNGFRLISYFYAGCPFPYPKYGINETKCADFLKEAERSLDLDLRSGDVIVIFNYHLSHLGEDQFGDVRYELYDHQNRIAKTFESKFNVYSTSLKDFADRAKSKGITIVLVGSPHRLVGYDPRLKKQQFGNRFGASVNLRLQEEYAKMINKKFNSLAKTIDNISFLNPLDPLTGCSSSLEIYSQCYIDSDHLSLSSATKINGQIFDKITK